MSKRYNPWLYKQIDEQYGWLDLKQTKKVKQIFYIDVIVAFIKTNITIKEYLTIVVLLYSDKSF